MNKESAREIFIDYVRKRGLRNTRQREQVLDIFLSAEKHITAEDLYNMVKKKYPEVGYATVHRNLKLLCECGLAEEMKIGNEKTRYEQKHGQVHHDHLICMGCGKIIEVKDPRIERLQDKLAEDKRFYPVRHRLEIYGFCRECRRPPANTLNVL